MNTDGTERAVREEAARLSYASERKARRDSMMENRRALWLGIVYTAAILGYIVGSVTHV